MGALLDGVASLPPSLVVGLVFLLPAVEASALVGLVVPGEFAVIIGGVVAHQGRLPLWVVVAAAFAGAVTGDTVGYHVGRRLGPALLARLPRWLRRAGQPERTLDLLRRRGAVAVVVGRWTAALRALVPGAAGMSGMAYRRFAVANVCGGALWAVAVAALGFFAGAGYQRLERRLSLSGELLFGVLIVIGAVAWYAQRRRRARRQEARR